ncbi:hypothetical protein C666_14460 [Thauera linaloolentis 47Lol = DSM 12138]|uniref:Uncharacterized protein n=1 Tax=Thauera linaloolentis (strain DSM 12138 / JCM 21573 / CCUG 41526 / CIP 105981 / IAM 15112 / NBRC 102519 / 47Lol) TaxID=1123367 RepID=N6XVU4_THAL4|nr:hypothetical protein C666_14460 [Thauera linaloolentis 47Lol = DSM 12138]
MVPVFYRLGPPDSVRLLLGSPGLLWIGAAHGIAQIAMQRVAFFGIQAATLDRPFTDFVAGGKNAAKLVALSVACLPRHPRSIAARPRFGNTRHRH